MSAQVCPGLYRVGMKFYCKYANREVNPGLMPCLSNFTECPFYKPPEKEKPKSVAPPTPPTPAEEATPKETPTPTAAISVKTTVPEVEVTETPEEELKRRLEEFETKILELEESWKKYESEALEALDRWDELSAETRRLIAGLSSSIEAFKAEKERINKKSSQGLLTPEESHALIQNINEKIEEYSRVVKELSEMLSRIERTIIPHMKRLMASRAKPELGKLRLSLMKLEELFKQGKISEKTYERLKSEIESRIAKLEKVFEEVKEA